MIIQDYKLVCDHNYSRFEGEIKELIALGWQLHGTTSYGSDIDSDGTRVYAVQALVFLSPLI